MDSVAPNPPSAGSTPVSPANDREIVIKTLLRDIKFNDWVFRVGSMGDGHFIQCAFMAQDNMSRDRAVIWQKGRKWYVSPYAIDQEIIQTAFKAVVSAVEHETREQFIYRGVPIFNPHIDLDALVAAAQVTAFRD
jgi:hypothetical protein